MAKLRAKFTEQMGSFAMYTAQLYNLSEMTINLHISPQPPESKTVKAGSNVNSNHTLLYNLLMYVFGKHETKLILHGMHLVLCKQ